MKRVICLDCGKICNAKSFREGYLEAYCSMCRKTFELPMRAPSKPNIPWEISIFRTATYRHGKRALFLLMSPTGKRAYSVMAIEHEINNTTDDIAATKEFFDNHAHAIVAVNVTEARAEKSAREYSDKWRKNQTNNINCDCKTIEAP